MPTLLRQCCIYQFSASRRQQYIKIERSICVRRLKEGPWNSLRYNKKCDNSINPEEQEFKTTINNEEQTISMENIRPLPKEFISLPAFAIPCRLYQICPHNGNQHSTWLLNDSVHDEFNRLMANNVICIVRNVQERICYDVQVEIPGKLFTRSYSSDN